MDVTRTAAEPTLSEELRASALLFALALGCTAGFALVGHYAIGLFGR